MFRLAANDVTRNGDSLPGDEESVVTSDVTKVTWRETHLREIVARSAELEAEERRLARERQGTRTDLEPSANLQKVRKARPATRWAGRSA